MSDIHAKMNWFMILAIFLLIKNLLHANFSSFVLLAFVVRGLPRPANQFNDRTAQGSSFKRVKSTRPHRGLNRLISLPQRLKIVNANRLRKLH